MAETFYGPWRIRLSAYDQLPPFVATSFVVTGSEDADGRYIPDSSEFWNTGIVVRGQRWTVQVDDDVDGSWLPAVAQFPEGSDGPRRSTRFVPGKGLVLTLETGGHSWHPQWGDPPLTTVWMTPTVRLECLCLDTTTNPIPIPNPYDFTVPHGPDR